MRAYRLIIANALVWLALGGLPLIYDSYYIGQLALYVVYGIFAMSLALIWGQIGLLCFGQAVFFGIGAYAMAVTTKGMLPGLESYTSSYGGLLFAVLLPALFANVLGRFLFYRGGLGGAYFAIVTLAIAIVAERLAINWKFTGGFNGLRGIPPLDLGIAGASFDLLDPIRFYYFVLIVAIAVYFSLWALTRSAYGTVLRAVRDGETRTTFFGYDVGSYKVAMFTLSGGIAGLSGALLVTQFGFASPSLVGFALSTEVLIWVALGGKTVILAAFLGAIIVRTVESELSQTLGNYWLLALGVGFVTSVIFLPRGLLGAILMPAPRGLRAKKKLQPDKDGREAEQRVKSVR
jgi:urea ABC transporter permease protein UrtC